MDDHIDYIWVFVGEDARFPGGLFYDLEVASAWIAKRGLTGVLTKYPVDVGAYDWALETGLFTPKKHEHFLPKFIGRFSSAAMDHFHFENGLRE